MSSKKSTRRERQSQQTRMEIVAAARGLFASRGYAATTVAEIARAAQVSPQTIYDSVGSKAQIVSLLNELIEDEAGIEAVTAPMAGEADPGVVLGTSVEVAARIFERCSDIVRVSVAARSTEGALAAVAAEGQRRHEEGCRRIAARLKQMGALRVDVETASDTITALADVVWWVTLHDDYGWTLARIRAWVQASMERLLLR